MTTTTTTNNNVTMKTLDINFFADNISDDMKKEFHIAIAYERNDMEVELIKTAIKKLDGKIENKDKKYTSEQVEGFKSEKNELVVSKEKLASDMSANFDTYNKVIDDMTRRDAISHDGNKKEVVRTVLRVLATVENSRLIKSAIVESFKTPELYEALETIHVNSNATENGAISLTKEVKEAYKEASKQLESIVKKTFSLPFETSYTSKTRVKINSGDRKLLHDCYVKNFTNKFSENRKTGVISFDIQKRNTLVTVKENQKTGELTYNYSGLATTIANIVLKHYFA